MKYLMIILSKSVLNISNLSSSKIYSRNYASCGIMCWDQPLNTNIKLKAENYWKNKGNDFNCNRTNNEANKYYVLSMFPYPSGSLHMGHVRVYVLSDTIARYYRMKDKYVIHPIGWDAFGLPAENAAIERKIDPAEWTVQNINQMKEQLKALGCSFDWDREIATCNPKYYKWTQALFLKLYKSNLVYKKEEYVNWDPVDKTVLAHEQVAVDGTSWRSGALVEKKLMNQWFIRTTAFAKSLLEGLNDPTLKQWRDIIKIQRNWIGECNGSNFKFEIISSNYKHPKYMDLWTDCAEFINDVKFVAVSKTSIFNERIFGENEKVATTQLPEIAFINPFTQTNIPVFLTDEVEFPNGRDEYLGIPCKSESDAKFCSNVGIEFEPPKEMTLDERIQKRNKIMLEARKSNLGGYLVSSHLKDWLISRQRYWGTPIPIINCDYCGSQAVPCEQLPVLLPSATKLLNKTLADFTEWKNVKCPSCGEPATRETDTMDTFVDSSWYYMRYLDVNNSEEMINKKLADSCLPVDLYIGGKEHALLHLYFSRFISYFLHSKNIVPTSEPFNKLLVVGFIMGKTYKVEKTGKYLSESDVEKVDGQCVEKSSGLPVTTFWDKMSKSKHNGVNPLELIKIHSVDTIRLLIMADCAPESQRNWTTDSFDIILNWENKLWLLMRQFIKVRNQYSCGTLDIDENEVLKDNTDMFNQRNYHIKGVCYNILGSQQLSVVISKLQSMTKRLRKASSSGMVKSREFERTLAALIIMITPLAPHFSSELWAGFTLAPGRIVNDGEIQWDKEVYEQKWPEIDMHYKLLLNVFVNNRLITKISVKRKTLMDSTIDQLIQIAENDPKIIKYLNNRKIVEAKTNSLCNLDLDLNLTVHKESEKLSQENVL